MKSVRLYSIGEKNARTKRVNPTNPLILEKKASHVIKKTLGASIVLVLFLIGNAFFLNYNAFRHFNYHDMGAFLDASWRVYRGQQPYVDFIFLTGPVHLYMNAFFFHLLGFGKGALLAHLIAVHSVVILVTYFMVLRQVPFFISLLVTLLTTTCFYWPVSHPWYDQSAHLWGILGVGLLTRQLFEKRQQGIFLTSFLCGSLVLLSFMTKSNIGTAYGVGFLLVLLTLPEKGKSLPGYFLGALLMTAVFLILFPPEHYFEQVFLFHRIAFLKRLSQAISIRGLFKNYYWVSTGMVAINLLIHWKQRREFLPSLTLFLTVMLVALFSISTGSIVKAANLPLWGVHMALAFILLYQVKDLCGVPHHRLLHRFSIGFTVLLTGWLIVLSANRGKELLAWRWMGQDPVGTYAIQAKPLQGWLSDKKMGRILDAMVRYVKREIPPSDSLLILADMEILYALTERESYRGIPHLWHRHRVPAPGPALERVKSHIVSHPPDWMILFEGPAIYPTNEPADGIVDYLELQAFIDSDYSEVRRWGPYILSRRKRNL